MNEKEIHMELNKPEGLSPEAARFWDENVEVMQSIMQLYINIAKCGDNVGFDILNFYVSICSQISASYLNSMDGPTQ